MMQGVSEQLIGCSKGAIPPLGGVQSVEEVGHIARMYRASFWLHQCMTQMHEGLKYVNIIN